MRKCFSLAVLGISIALLSLTHGVTPAFASTWYPAVLHKPSTSVVPAEPVRWHPSGWQDHYQYFHGNSYSGDHLTFRGHNQNNSGNQGYNRRHNYNFGANAGNLVINHNKASHQRTHQYYSGNSVGHNWGYFIGYNQNNTGNQGHNDGLNEDHGGNAGNQVVN